MQRSSKICGRCKQEKPLTDFYVRRETNGHMSKCKTCNNSASILYQNKRYKTDPKFKQASVDRMGEWRKRPENKEKYLGHVRKATRKQRENLAPCYVKHVLVIHSNLKSENVPDSLVKAKRESLKIVRQLRSMK